MSIRPPYSQRWKSHVKVTGESSALSPYNIPTLLRLSDGRAHSKMNVLRDSTQSMRRDKDILRAIDIAKVPAANVTIASAAPRRFEAIASDAKLNRLISQKYQPQTLQLLALLPVALKR
ncbi:hypothetical protein QE152_g21657 [Popillia japonica]|uniref:Uncharacterized protein n=1 Tax=Popillia japonica TaxID=7064 RepID=A0AAW1KMU6_POPJA